MSRKQDWNCYCGEMNFASRNQCRRCGSQKPNQGNTNAKPGDWKCSCGENNFASRNQCRRCGAQKLNQSISSSTPVNQNAKPGDWNCSCGEMNFASRTQCYRCGAQKLTGSSLNQNPIGSSFNQNTGPSFNQNTSSSFNLSTIGSSFNQNTNPSFNQNTSSSINQGFSSLGGWNCSCGEMNLSSRNVCQRCGAQSQWNGSTINQNNPFNSQNYHESVQVLYDSNNPSTLSFNFGNNYPQQNWNCTCGDLNLASREVCQRCGAQRLILPVTPINQNYYPSSPPYNSNQNPPIGSSFNQNTGPSFNQNTGPTFNQNANPSFNQSTVGSSFNQNTGLFNQSSTNSKPGDWNCSCGEMNFASRTQCYRCGAQKLTQSFPHTVNQSINSKPGDWNCSCGEMNFASRTQCRRCGKQKY